MFFSQTYRITKLFAETWFQTKSNQRIKSGSLKIAIAVDHDPSHVKFV